MSSSDDSMEKPLLENEDSFNSSESEKKTTPHEKIMNLKNKFLRPITKGSMRGSIFCLLTIYFGSGLLALPYSVKMCGVILAPIIYLFAIISLYITLKALVDVAYENNIIDYNGLVLLRFGKTIAKLTSLITIISNFGVIIVYMQIISNFLLSIFPNFSFIQSFGFTDDWKRFIQMNLVCIGILIPVSIVEDTKILYLFSFFGTSSFLFIVFDCIVEFPWYFANNFSFDKIKYFDTNSDITKVFCMYMFTLGNHIAILSVLNDLKNPTKKKGEKVVRYAYNFAISIGFIIMMLGYFSTFDETKELLIDRSNQSILLILAKYFYILSVIFSIGTFYYITKPSIVYLLPDNDQIGNYQLKIIHIISFLGMNLIAFLFNSISTVMAFIGGTTTIYQCFIIPILLKLKERNLTYSKKTGYILILITVCTIGTTYMITLIKTL